MTTKKAKTGKHIATVRPVLGAAPEAVYSKLSEIKNALDELLSGGVRDGVLLEVENGKAVVLVKHEDGEWSSEDFMEQVEWIGDHGGNDQRPDELAVWRDAFLAAAKRCDERIAET